MAAPRSTSIPKTGGNTFTGTGFWSTAGEWSQGSNIDDRLRSYGFIAPAALIKNWDANFALGGPIVRDRLWFYGNARTYGSHTDVPNAFANANAGNAAVWDYVQDQSIKSRNVAGKKIGAIRLTGQPTPKNKLTFYYDYQQVCNGSAFEKGGEQCRDRGDDWVGLGTATAAPETGNVWDDREKIVQAAWTSTATNKLLLEAGLSSFNSGWGGYIPAGADNGLIPVTEQSTLAGVPVPNYLPRLRVAALERSAAQRLAGVGLLRHRRPQHEGGLPGGVSGAAPVPVPRTARSATPSTTARRSR